MVDPLRKPRKLSPNSRIAVVSPSWGGPATFPNRFEAGKKQFSEEFGVELVEMPNCRKPAEWLHMNPKARAEDLMLAFSDSTIDGIVASIGGDDAIRLIPYLDLDIIANNPKVFMGYSDTTTLHFACYKAGVSSFYGPSIMAGFAENAGIFPYMREAISKTLFSSEAVGLIPEAKEWTVEHLEWGAGENQLKRRQTKAPLGRSLLQGHGVVEGHLLGGCIDVFPMILGTSIWPSVEQFDGAILFLETSEEAPKPDDMQRILRNLGTQGILHRLSALLIGRPGGNVDDLRQYDVAFQKTLSEEFGLSDLPILAQMDFGHTDPMCVLPYGARTRVDCSTKEVIILGSACI